MPHRSAEEHPFVRRDSGASRSVVVLAVPLAILFASGAVAHAEPQRDSGAPPISIDVPRATDDGRTVIDEIVVYGNRDPGSADRSPRLPIDPLRARVLEELRELDVLEGEFDWRAETARIEISPPRVRFGYDPRNDGRAPSPGLQQTLPLDLVRPATLVSVDF